MTKRTIVIKDVCDFNSETIGSVSQPEEIQYLDTGNITRNRIDNVQILNRNKTSFPSRAQRRVKNKTIIYSTVRPIQEHFGFLSNPADNFIVSTGFLTIDVKDQDVDPKFLYYALTQKNITAYLHTIATNNVSSYPSINPDDVGNLKLDIPKEKKHQQAIAAVLTSIDDKISLNHRINVELEAMAKTIYNYWFVQFDFLDKDGKPYKSSGGKMVWNAELKREIPEGWEVLQLSDIITRSGTGLNPRDNFKLGEGNNYYVTIKNVNNGKIVLDEKCDKVDDEALRIINKRSDLRPGDVLFTSIEPVGVTYLLQETPSNWNINESVFTLRPNYERITSEYLFMLLSSSEMKAFTKNVSAGSIHKGIRHGVLKTFKLAYIKSGLINKFSEMLSPILRRIDKIDKENQQLKELRDWLLPMLMNGQVKVN